MPFPFQFFSAKAGIPIEAGILTEAENPAGLEISAEYYSPSLFPQGRFCVLLLPPGTIFCGKKPMGVSIKNHEKEHVRTSERQKDISCLPVKK